MAANTSLPIVCVPKKGSRGVWRECPLLWQLRCSIIAAEWEEMNPGMLFEEVRAGGRCHRQVRTRCNLARD